MMKIKIVVIIFFTALNVYSQSNKVAPQKTLVTPHLQAHTAGDTNIVYCSTFQMAWDDLKRTAGENIVLSEKKSPLPEDIVLVNNLNAEINAKDLVNKKDCYVTSGVATAEYINKVNKVLEKKFKGVFEPINDSPNAEQYLFYSFLYKKLRFKKTFETRKDGMLFNGNTDKSKKVKAFGVNPISHYSKNRKRKKLLKQIEVYISPQNQNEYLIKINSRNKNEEIILAKFEPLKTLNETIEKALKLSDSLVKSKNYSISEVAIPEIDLDIEHNYTELIGKKIHNKRFDKKVIAEAQQGIMFKLDKQGATIKSRAKISTLSMARFDGSYSYRLVFDKPFLLILKEKNKKQPYFAIWIANEELLKYVSK